jgi:hypothetical protein
MFGLSSFVWKLLAGAVALMAVVGFIYFSGVEAGKAKLRPDLNHYRDAARDYKAASRTWKGRYTAERDQRATDARNARDGVSSDRSDCAAEIEAALRRNRPLNRILAKPVKLDAANCPIRTLVSTDELTAILTREVR